MAPVRTIEELEARQAEIRGRLQEIHVEFDGQAFPDDARAEWNSLNDEIEATDELIGELRARKDRVAALSEDGNHTELPAAPTARGRRVSRRIPDNVHDVVEYRKFAQSLDELPELYREGAREVLERVQPAHPRADKAKVQEHVSRLLDTADRQHGDLAQRIIATGSELYKRAFGKMWSGQPLTGEEQRALSLTTTAGGFAVPYELDPTVIPTSNGTVNPFRQIARIESITTNEWRGVSSAGVTAAYAAEAAEASDNAPTLAQPTANPERAQVFIPFSIEIGGDWSSLQTEMARLVQDAKDDLEANKFVHGTGHSNTQPEGLLVGGTAVVSTAAATTLTAADLYSLEEGLPPRFRPRASIVGNRKQYNRVRALDTQGGAQMWIRIGDGLNNSSTGALGEALLGYPTYEASEMVSTLTSASSIITIGDFSYFLIVDRVGMNAEVLPHLLGSNRRPTGQRGLFFWWRNTSDVLAMEAFRTLKVT